MFAPLTAVPVLLFVVMYVLVGSEDDAWSPIDPLWLGILVVVSGAAVTVIHVLGYRSRPGSGPDGVEAFRALAMLRFSMAEAPALVGLVLAFTAFEGRMTLVSLGAGVSLVLMCLHVWPNDRQIERVQQSMAAGGSHVQLREALYADTSPLGG